MNIYPLLLANLALVATAIGAALWVRHPYKGPAWLVALYLAIAICGLLGLLSAVFQLGWL